MSSLPSSYADSVVSVSSLTYSHRSDIIPSLSDVNLDLPKGSRTLLIGDYIRLTRDSYPQVSEYRR